MFLCSIKYAWCFVVFCFLLWFLVTFCDRFTHILLGHFTGTAALPLSQWNNPEEYGWNQPVASQVISNAVNFLQNTPGYTLEKNCVLICLSNSSLTIHWYKAPNHRYLSQWWHSLMTCMCFTPPHESSPTLFHKASSYFSAIFFHFYFFPKRQCI